MTKDANLRRSQAIQRLPVNSLLATLILYNGERSDVLLFIPPGEEVTRLVSPGPPFVPMIRNAQFCLVARTAIAAIGVVVGTPPTDDDALPVVHRRVRIGLRSGTLLEGEVQWIAGDDHKRTSDHVNEPTDYLVAYAPASRTIFYVVKSQVATIEEIA